MIYLFGRSLMMQGNCKTSHSNLMYVLHGDQDCAVIPMVNLHSVSNARSVVLHIFKTAFSPG